MESADFKIWNIRNAHLKVITTNAGRDAIMNFCLQLRQHVRCVRHIHARMGSTRIENNPYLLSSHGALNERMKFARFKLYDIQFRFIHRKNNNELHPVFFDEKHHQYNKDYGTKGNDNQECIWGISKRQIHIHAIQTANKGQRQHDC